VDSIPQSLKCGVATGIGLFITLIGHGYGGLVMAAPGTLVRLGDFRHPVTLVSVLGFVVMPALLAFPVRGAILNNILATTAPGPAWRTSPLTTDSTSVVCCLAPVR
jgi:AGZA family xanthine/uracil permease-like MFS transporter